MVKRPPRLPVEVWVVLSYAVYVVFLLRNFLFGKGTVGLIYDWGYPLLTKNTTYQQTLSLLSETSAGISNGYNTGFMAVGIHWIFTHFFQSPEISTRFEAFGFMTIACWSMYLLAHRYGFSRKVAWLTGLIYGGSYFMISRLSAGYVWYLPSVAFFPLLLLSYKALCEKGVSWVGVAKVALCLPLALCQVQFLAFALIFLVGDGLFVLFHSPKLLKGRLVALFATLAAWLIQNTFWMYTLSKAKGIPSANGLEGLAYASHVQQAPSTILNVLLGTEFANTHLMMVEINATPVRVLLLIGLGIALVCALLNAKRTGLVVGSLALIGFILPLSLGGNAPFTETLVKAIAVFSPLSIFREPGHLQYLYLLATAVLGAAAFEYIEEGIGRTKYSLKSVMVLASSAAVLILALAPALSGDIYGYLGRVEVPVAVDQLDAAVQASGSGRVFYPPSLNFWRVKDDLRTGSSYPDELAISLSRPFVTQASSDFDGQNPTWRLRNALISSYQRGDTGRVLPLLKMLGSDTIVIRDGLVSNFPASVGFDTKDISITRPWLMETPRQQLEKNAAIITKRKEIPGAVVAGVDGAGFMATSTNLSLVCSYQDITSSTDAIITNPSSPLAAYAKNDCSPEEIARLQGVRAKLSRADLVHTPTLGWSPAQLSFWRSPALALSRDALLYTEVPGVIELTQQAQGAGTVQYFVSPRGGSLSVNNRVVSTIAPEEGWKQIEVGTDKVLTIQALGGDNAIGWVGVPGATTLAAMADQKLASATLSDASYAATRLTANLTTADSALPALVTVQANYFPGWKAIIAGQELAPIQLNEYAFGFLIPKGVQGELVVSFGPQRAYSLLIALSFVSWFTALAVVLRRRRI